MAVQVWVRLYNEKDPIERKLFVEWLYARRAENRFNPEIFVKNQVKIWTAFDETGIRGFIPLTVAYVLESLAFAPGTPPIVEATALKAMQAVLIHRASENNIPDAYFVTRDEAVLAFAKKYGWRDVAVPLLNLHFSDLEGKHESNDKPAA
jgi:hypothetical protein